jgi:hypothetical protein
VLIVGTIEVLIVGTMEQYFYRIITRKGPLISNMLSSFKGLDARSMNPSQIELEGEEFMLIIIIPCSD